MFLPNKLLESLPRLSRLPSESLRWNTNEVKHFVPSCCLRCPLCGSGLKNMIVEVSAGGTVINGALSLQEIAAYLISFDRHDEWLSCTLKTR